MAIRSAMPLLQSPLERQKGLALHEKQGKRRKADVRHRVVHLRIRASPCIRKISANRRQSRQKADRGPPSLKKGQFLALENSYVACSPCRTAAFTDKQSTKKRRS